LLKDILDGAAVRWVKYTLGVIPAATQVTTTERECLIRHARGRSSIVELGVMHGATTALFRQVMAADGIVVGVDPHPPGRLGVSFERLTARREVGRHARGHAMLIRKPSAEAVAGWERPIDFLFIDADHSWAAIERDWYDWVPHVMPGGIIALHDSHSVAGRPDLDSVRFTEQVVLHDRRVCRLEVVDSLTIFERQSRRGRS
jgi:predicted O-methyltransferase YrrM